MSAGGDESRLPARIVHVHIPKTAGSALSEAFQRASGGRLRVYPARYEEDFRPAEYAGHDFFTGHIGFKVASEIGGELITVLRDPVDQFLSMYFFMRQMYADGTEISVKTTLAARHDLDQFVRIRDEPALEQAVHNRMLWQLAYSNRLELRREFVQAGLGDDELIRIAIANLGRFAIVGLQADMAGVAEAIRRRYDIALSIGRGNVTGCRLALSDIPLKTREQIEWWVHLDQELYTQWLRIARNRNASSVATPDGRGDIVALAARARGT